MAIFQQPLGDETTQFADWVVGFVLLLVTFALAVPTWNEIIGIDEGLYLFGAQQVLLGKLPHIDFFSMLPPGVYLFGAAALKYFGLTGLRFILVVLSGTNAILCYCITRKTLPIGPVFPFLGGFLYVWNAVYENRFLSHNSLSLPLALAAVFFFISSIRASERRFFFLALSGFLAGLAAFFSQNIGVYLLLVGGVVLGIKPFFLPKEKEVLKEVFLFCALWAIVPCFFLFFYFLKGGLGVAIDQLFFSLQDYYQMNSTHLPYSHTFQDTIQNGFSYLGLQPPLKTIYVLLMGYAPPVLFICILLACLFLRKKCTHEEQAKILYQTMGTALFGGAFWWVTITGTFWSKFLMYTALLDALALGLVGWGLAFILKNLPLFPRFKSVGIPAIGLICLTVIGVRLYANGYEVSCVTHAFLCSSKETHQAEAFTQVTTYLDSRLKENTCLFPWPYSADVATFYPLHTFQHNQWIYLAYNIFDATMLEKTLEELKQCEDLVIVKDAKYEQMRSRGDPRKKQPLEETAARILLDYGATLTPVLTNEYYQVTSIKD